MIWFRENALLSNCGLQNKYLGLISIILLFFPFPQPSDCPCSNLKPSFIFSSSHHSQMSERANYSTRKSHRKPVSFDRIRHSYVFGFKNHGGPRKGGHGKFAEGRPGDELNIDDDVGSAAFDPSDPNYDPEYDPSVTLVCQIFLYMEVARVIPLLLFVTCFFLDPFTECHFLRSFPFLLPFRSRFLWSALSLPSQTSKISRMAFEKPSRTTLMVMMKRCSWRYVVASLQGL